MIDYLDNPYYYVKHTTMQNIPNPPSLYAQQIATQLRKGFLAYCVLKVCRPAPIYTSDILKQLRQAQLVVVEGTIYPLLSKLQKDGLLAYSWQESGQGPPRKYYAITDFGSTVMELVQEEIYAINDTLEKLANEDKS
jgi:PadR family transcriptional regulator PadR